MRFLVIPLTILLALQGCAPITPQAAPEAAPVKSEASTSGSRAEESVKLTYEAGVLAAVWETQARGFQLELVEPSTGELVPGFTPIPIGMNYQYSFSPDGQTLAVIGYESDQSPTRPTLHLIDLSTWKDNPIEVEVRGWASGPAFSPDGKYLAAALNDRESTLMILDLEQQAVMAETAPDLDISRLKFTADGSALMAYGRVVINRFTANERAGGPATAVLFDAQDLSTRWSADLQGVRDGIYPT
ncbi:MAG: WD40 repeat domain-containing protein, partial [Gammaproteobacteria bacterium]